MTQYWGSTKHFFLLILYNLKNIEGARVPPPPPTPQSLSKKYKMAALCFAASLVLFEAFSVNVF